MAAKDWLKKYPRIRQTAGKLIAKIPPSFRMGKQFWYWYSFFRESEKWTPDQLNNYQYETLRDLLGELYRTSSFYRKRLDGIDISQIDSLASYQKAVPDLSRDEYINNLNEIISSEINRKNLIKAQTSGTTGKALQFYHTREDDLREWAAICHQWGRVGYNPGVSRRTEFRGLVLSDKLIDYFPENNMMRCSILNMKKENIKLYGEAISREKADFYHGYPSALYLLAITIIREGLKFPQPDAILLASEQVYEHQLEALAEAFPKTKLLAHYGCAERTVLAGWCEHKREYHVMPQYGIAEVDNKTGEIIGTNLFNRVNGFIRYRMTDTVLAQSSDVCPDCGRGYVPRFISIGGRSEDYLYSPEKGWIPPAIVTYPLKALKLIREIQFIQKEKNKLTIRYLVPEESDRNLIREELKQVEAGLAQLMGRGMEFVFEQIWDFPRTASGKFKWIVSELDKTGMVLKDG